MEKTVYVGMAADIIHKGHINLLNMAKKYGKVTVGLLNDEAVKSYKREPIINYENRYIVMESLKMVDNIMEQKTHDYTDNLRLLKPNYVVHGDDWIDGQSVIRKKVIEVLSEFDGELIEVPYTGGISTTDIINKIKNIN
jgi:phosphoenolpyruvate phosphomutase